MVVKPVQRIVLIYFLLTTVYWLWLQNTGYRHTNWNYFYSVAFSVVPLIGGFYTFLKADAWAHFKSTIGRAVSFFSSGLVLWGIGSMIWAYYNFVVHESAPYPSVADIFYVVGFLFWTIGIFYLSKASGARFSLKRSGMKLVAFLVAVVVAAISYDLIVNVAREGMLVTAGDPLLKTILDMAYPFFDIIMLVGSVLLFGLSVKALGGAYRLSVFVWLLGIAINYVADFVFSYTTTTGSFYVGNWGDLIFALATSMMTFGVLGFVSMPSAQKTTRRAT